MYLPLDLYTRRPLKFMSIRAIARCQKKSRRSKTPCRATGCCSLRVKLKIITSNQVLTRVVDEMGLRDDPEFNVESGIIPNIKGLFGVKPSDPAALTALRNLHLKTAAKRNDRSFVIDIMASADTPERATRLADALANAYVEEQAGANANFNRRISEAMTSQLERLRNAVNQSEQAVAAYKAANNLVGARNRLVTEQELDEANTQLTSAKTRLNEAQSRVKLIDTIVGGGAPLDALPQAIQSGTIVQLRARAADISREEAQLAQINGPKHPALQAARAQGRDVQALIDKEVNLIAQAVRNAAISEQTNVQNLQARFDSLKTLSQTNEKAIVPLRELERKADANRTIYETFLSKAKTASEQQVIDTTNIRMVSRASPPEHKSWPPTKIMMAAALFGGLIFGIAMALARDSLGARQRVGKPAGMPPNPGRKRADAAKPAPQLAYPPTIERNEQLSRLSAELLAAPAGHTTLLVRASADDSLSLIGLELARAAEAAGKKVIVIDADLNRHRMTSRLLFDQRLGIRDVLAGTSMISDVAQVLDSTNIRIVPVGLAGLPGSDNRIRSAFSAALKKARDFECVIVDGGELGAMPSGYGLYSMADEVIFLTSTRDKMTDDVLVLVDVLQHRRIKAKAVFIEQGPETMAA